MGQFNPTQKLRQGDYPALGGLSAEAREKFKALRPLTVGQAARIPGVR
ncbi:MAG: hypothetical protein LBI91_02040 [Spirochaetaceae bacterium]|nr:hypothetical protein [Spirochaetaceae bacterium]